jgi:hypothetical protein
MTWKYKPDNAWQKPGASRITRAHWFETDAHWSLCGRVPHGDGWIDDVGGARNDCRACEKRIMRLEDIE